MTHALEIEMEPAALEPVTIRNSRFLIGAVLLFAVVSFLTAAAMIILALTELFPLSGYTVGRALGVLSWLVGFSMSASLGATMWQASLKMAHSEAHLDTQGVRFRLGTRKKPQEDFIHWNQMAAVRHRRVGNHQCYGVFSRDGQVVEFSGFTFFRPKKLALQIAARSGQSIEEAK